MWRAHEEGPGHGGQIKSVHVRRGSTRSDQGTCVMQYTSKYVLKQRNLQTTKAARRPKCSLKLQRQRSLLA